MEYEREPDTSSFKSLPMVLSSSGFNMKITDESKTPLYYVESNYYKLGKPDLTLHVGTDKTGPVVGVCKCGTISSTMKFALGDPAGSGGQLTKWEDMERKSMDHSRFRWEMDLDDGSRRGFQWKRTHAHGASQDSQSSFKLVDEMTGQIVALYLEDGSWSMKKAGAYKLQRGWGEKWERMVILSSLILLLKKSIRDAANGF